MSLAIKLALTGTFAAMVLKTWLEAIAVATVDVLASNSGRLTAAQQAKITKKTGGATLKAIGLTMWLTALVTTLWIFL